jgi:hypothetical protein
MYSRHLFRRASTHKLRHRAKSGERDCEVVDETIEETRHRTAVRKIDGVPVVRLVAIARSFLQKRNAPPRERSVPQLAGSRRPTAPSRGG